MMFFVGKKLHFVRSSNFYIEIATKEKVKQYFTG